MLTGLLRQVTGKPGTERGSPRAWSPAGPQLPSHAPSDAVCRLLLLPTHNARLVAGPWPRAKLHHGRLRRDHCRSSSVLPGDPQGRGGLSGNTPSGYHLGLHVDSELVKAAERATTCALLPTRRRCGSSWLMVIHRDAEFPARLDPPRRVGALESWGSESPQTAPDPARDGSCAHVVRSSPGSLRPPNSPGTVSSSRVPRQPGWRADRKGGCGRAWGRPPWIRRRGAPNAARPPFRQAPSAPPLRTERESGSRRAPAPRGSGPARNRRPRPPPWPPRSAPGDPSPGPSRCSQPLRPRR